MKRLLVAGESSVPVLTLAKLVNVALSMLWGFAVTFVFVRALPTAEFRAFLLLVAFNNFTVSAEFGFTNVVYARLRRHWLAARGGSGQPDDEDFRNEEIGVLFQFLLSLIILGGVIVGAAIYLGWIGTALPLVFLLFFLASALNVMLLLAKRALAALDCNFLWEVLDIARRLLTLTILFSVLAGLPLLASVAIQLSLNLLLSMLGMVMIHRLAGMKLRHWFSVRAGGGHIRSRYLGDVGASVALTISETTAYNGPYFVIAALSHDHRLLLLYDFAFKMLRAVSTAIRATVESALPRLTRAWFAGDNAAFQAGRGRATGIAIGIATCASLLVLMFGQRIFGILYDKTVHVEMVELLLLCVSLVALALVCISVYVQGALGRFVKLLAMSLPFLAGSMLMTPATLTLHGQLPGISSGAVFMSLYAVVMAGSAAMHMMSVMRMRSPS